ncbi:hypothetical protein [Shewanella sp. TB7-MNA-CIBAN-0143]|uniref:hypothetical protein n=1 Tax=Shewanella sp. TB7-MNA-CIBAN-0143 TaxID=3140465 RepID=UPI003321EDC4
MLAATYSGIMAINSQPTKAAIPFYNRQLKIWTDIAKQHKGRNDTKREQAALGVAAAYKRLSVKVA